MSAGGDIDLQKVTTTAARWPLQNASLAKGCAAKILCSLAHLGLSFGKTFAFKKDLNEISRC